MDSLIQFRDLTIAGQRGGLKDGQIQFASTTFDASTETPIVVNQVPATLGALWHVIYAADQKLPAGSYLVSARDFKVKHFPANVRAELAEYLTGQRSTTQYLSGAGAAAAGAIALPGAPGVAAAIGDVGQPSQELARAFAAAALAQEQVADTPQSLNTMSEISAHEIPTVTRESSIRTPGKQFPYAKTLMQRIDALDLKYREAQESKTGAASATTTAPAAPGTKRPTTSADGKRVATEAKLNPEDQIPIIIVPSSRTSLISLRNAVEFFGKSNFVDSSTVPNAPSGHSITLDRPSVLNPNKKARFLIIDNPAQLPANAWRRVVALFVTGQTWQLEGIPIGKGTPAEIFAEIPGYYLMYEGEPANENAKNWLVKTIQISRVKRYLDSMVVSSFWNEVTAWIAAHNASRRLYY